MKRRTEITIETERILVIRKRNYSIRAWCEPCGRQVGMVTPEVAGRRAGLSPRAIYRFVETDRLHFLETAEGLLLICLESLWTTFPEKEIDG